MLRRFGNNPYGRPLWRVIWSEDRLRFECGAVRRTYGEGRNRWMVERWCSPLMYGDRAAWEAMREADGSASLGPFPNEGDYEWAYTFESPDGEGVPLEPELLELVCRCVERSKLLTDSQRKIAIDAKRAKDEAARKQRMEDVFDEAQGPFMGQPVSGIPSKRLPEDVVIRDIAVPNHGPFSQAS